MNKEEAVHIYFSGRVQGVGFRYTARELALKFNIKGWVKNIDGGRVELLACGKQKKIMEFLDALRSMFSGFIIKEQESSWEPQGDLEGFSIDFY